MYERNLYKLLTAEVASSKACLHNVLELKKSFIGLDRIWCLHRGKEKLGHARIYNGFETVVHIKDRSVACSCDDLPKSCENGLVVRLRSQTVCIHTANGFD